LSLKAALRGRVDRDGGNSSFLHRLNRARWRVPVAA